MRKKKGIICLLIPALLLFITGCSRNNNEGLQESFQQEMPEIISFSFTTRGVSTADCNLYSLSKDLSGVHLYTEGLYSGGLIVDGDVEDSAMEQLIEIIKKHNICGWDGFDKADKTALDGEGFTISISFTDGSSVYANGSNKFPDGYNEAKVEIISLFDDLIAQYGETDQ